MELTRDACYTALVAHDARFDGRFFVGVSSTGIYCRPVCRAKVPKPENCAFYGTAAAAERAGYRPCLRCRPELAPGRSRVDAESRLAACAASRIEDGILADKSLAALAADLKISERHLRRVIETTFGVSPVEMAQTARLLLAKRLLTDTDLPVTEIALSAGFGSVRRFNALFAERYRLTPTAIRRRREGSKKNDVLRYELPYKPPFAWHELLDFLDGHRVQGVEAIDDGIYRRTVRMKDKTGVVSVSLAPDRNAVYVELSSSLAGVSVAVLRQVKRLFDLDADPVAITERLGALATDCPGLRVPGAFDPFEVIVRAILAQQTPVATANVLTERFVAAFGTPTTTPFPSLTYLFPTPERVMQETVDTVAALGIPLEQTKGILALSKAIASQAVSLNPTGDFTEAARFLKELPGIREEVAQYIAMRAFGDPDAFSPADVGLQTALGTTSAAETLAKADDWRPWRSYAVMHLLGTVDERKTK